MKILHVLLSDIPIPPTNYGGTERVLWALYQGQTALGHQVKFLTKYPNKHPDALLFNPKISLETQLTGWADIIHFHYPYDGDIDTPFVCTEHGNYVGEKEFNINTIYLSSKHAKNNNADCYVHNGLFWQDYGQPNLNSAKEYAHFLAKASWSVKNLKGAIKIAKKAQTKLSVLGGSRINLRRRNPYVYFSKNLKFYGMVGGEKKNALIAHSKALIFPVLWHEPFGLAVIESLYLGCPVLASPFGALPDIINQDNIGLLSDNYEVLSEALKTVDRFDRHACHEHARLNFSHLSMSKAYIECYEKVLENQNLNRTRPKSMAIPDPVFMK